MTKEQQDAVRKFYAPYKAPNLVFHEYFTEKTGEFYENYIPIDLYVGYIDPYYNDIKAAKYIDNKCYYEYFFHSIPQPDTLVKRVNGLWLNEKNIPVSFEQIGAIIAEEEGVFLKECEGTAGGFGVTYISKCDDMLGKLISVSSSISTDIIVQKTIKQHIDMASVNPSSVNSLRIYSILERDGTVHPYSSVFRVGVGETKVDNYSSGGLSIGITEEGYLRKYGYNKKAERFEKHPSTGVTFEHYKLPSYDRAIDLVKKAHVLIPHFRSVSWDIAINEEGMPILIEANLCRGGIDLLQLSNGPLFGRDTKKILDEVFG